MAVAIISGPQPAQKIVATITGDGNTTSFSVTHRLGQDVTVSLHDPYGREVVAGFVAKIDGITVEFGHAPAEGMTYRLIMIG